MKLPQIQNWFVVQWHITDKCNFKCKFCYIPHEYKTGMKRRELSYDDIVKIIDDICELAKNFNLMVRINFTGGDPLLREDFFDIARYAKSKGIFVSILGNPITDEDIVRELKKLRVFRYQISIDGLKDTHEYFRGKNSWDLAIKSLKLLGEFGITRVVLTTVSRINYHEVPKLIEYLYKNNLVEIYDFSGIVPIGEGGRYYEECLKPEEFRELLFKVYFTYKKLYEEGYKPHIGTKDPLWALMYHDLGILRPEVYKLVRVRHGCSIGWFGLVIDVDGKVYGCRRLPEEVGDVTVQKIGEIFFTSPKLKNMREVKRIDGCKDCLLWGVCRGCRAIAWAISKGNYFARDPRCWKVVDNLL